MGNSLAWHTPTLPLPPENNPRLVFERLFGDVGSTETAARLAHMRQDRSILDYVSERAASLNQSLGASDRSRLQEYLDGVRDIETRIQKAEAQSGKEMPVVNEPVGIPATFEDHAKLMYDLQVLAYQADLTRVITFMYGREFSGRPYPEIGVPEGHHPLSHHQNDPDKLLALSKVNTYHVKMFAYFLDRMAKTPDGDGSLLDHTLLIYGAGMGDSNLHAQTDIPVMLVGGPNQRIKGGRHLRYEGDSSAKLLVTVMDKLGVPHEISSYETYPFNVYDSARGITCSAEVRMGSDPHEVEDVFEVPLAFLLDPGNHRYESAFFKGRMRHYWAMPYGDRFIWGATAGMLVTLQRILIGVGEAA